MEDLINIKTLARLLLTSTFLISGIRTTFNINGFSNLVSSKNIPFPYFITLCVIALKIIASISIILNKYTQFASISLIIFTIMATFLFHNIFIDYLFHTRSIFSINDYIFFTKYYICVCIL